MKIIVLNNKESCNKLKKELTTSLQEFNPEILCFTNDCELLNYIKSNEEKINYIFLDLLNKGIEIANKLIKLNYKNDIVFTVQNFHNNIKVIQGGSTDYMCKTYSQYNCLDSFIENIKNNLYNESQECIVLSCIGEYRVVKISDIKYFTVSDKLVTIHYLDQTFSFISSLRKLENKLWNKGFIRIGRKYLIAQSYIAQINYRKIILKDNTVIKCTAAVYKTIEKEFSGDGVKRKIQ